MSREPVKCARCGLIRRAHVGMEHFCPTPDGGGRTFVYASSKPKRVRPPEQKKEK